MVKCARAPMDWGRFRVVAVTYQNTWRRLSNSLRVVPLSPGISSSYYFDRQG